MTLDAREHAATACITIHEAQRRVLPLELDEDRRPWPELCDRLENGTVSAWATRPAPTHVDSRFQGTIEPTPIWFKQYLNEGGTGTTDWMDWYLHGGVQLDRAAVERLEAELLNRKIDAPPEFAFTADGWPLVEALAWIATRDALVVATVMKTVGRAGSSKRTPIREAFGLELVRRSSISSGADEPHGLEVALSALKRAIRAGTAAASAILEDGSIRRLDPTELIHLDLVAANHGLPANRLSLPQGIARIELAHEEVLKIWPRAPATAASRQVRWSEERMTAAIKDSGITGFPAFWDFIASEDHGWGKATMKDHFPKARGTQGKRGRPKTAR